MGFVLGGLVGIFVGVCLGFSIADSYIVRLCEEETLKRIGSKRYRIMEVEDKHDE